MKKISIIVPCLNEEDALPIFYEEVNKVIDSMSDVDVEYLFINDGSKDSTLFLLKEMAEQDPRVRYLSFSKNFGKEAAMYAGLQHATGNYVTTMDVDLQDPPYLLKEMYDSLQDSEYDCCATRSTSRNGYGFLKKTFTRWFYKIINKLSDIEMVDGARDFRLMTRQMVDSILEMKEYNRYSKGLFSFVGYNTKWIEYENPERIAGTTTWNFWKLFIYAIEGIVAFSTAPLVASAIVGLLFCFIAAMIIVVIITKTLIWDDPVSRWPSLACILFFVSGIQLFCLGIMGMYLSKTYLETKQRPVYIIKETEMD